MDEALLRRVVGLLTLGVIAFLLSWLLPRPGLERLQGEGERVVTMDLTRPDSQPEELSAEEAASRERLRSGMDVADAALLAEVQGVAVPRAERPVSAPDPADRSRAPAGDDAPPDTDSENVSEPAPAPPQPVAPIEPAGPASKPEPKPEPRPAPLPQARPEPKVEPKPALEAEPKVEPKPGPKPAAKPQPEPAKPVPKAEPAKPAPKPAAPATGKTRVQAGAYSHLDSAEAVRAKAGAQGVACVISPAETAKGTLYRLRCGPYADRAAADAAVRKLKAASIPAAVVGD